jgi:hypothetical protein
MTEYPLSVSTYCDFNPGRIEIGYPGKRVDCGIIHQLIDVDAETKGFFLIHRREHPRAPAVLDANNTRRYAVADARLNRKTTNR